MIYIIWEIPVDDNRAVDRINPFFCKIKLLPTNNAEVMESTTPKNGWLALISCCSFIETCNEKLGSLLTKP